MRNKLGHSDISVLDLSIMIDDISQICIRLETKFPGYRFQDKLASHIESQLFDHSANLLCFKCNASICKCEIKCHTQELHNVIATVLFIVEFILCEFYCYLSATMPINWFVNLDILTQFGFGYLFLLLFILTMLLLFMITPRKEGLIIFKLLTCVPSMTVFSFNHEKIFLIYMIFIFLVVVKNITTMAYKHGTKRIHLIKAMRYITLISLGIQIIHLYVIVTLYTTDSIHTIVCIGTWYGYYKIWPYIMEQKHRRDNKNKYYRVTFSFPGKYSFLPCVKYNQTEYGNDSSVGSVPKYVPISGTKDHQMVSFVILQTDAIHCLEKNFCSTLFVLSIFVYYLLFYAIELSRMPFIYSFCFALFTGSLHFLLYICEKLNYIVIALNLLKRKLVMRHNRNKKYDFI